jgi:hypothetical protein
MKERPVSENSRVRSRGFALISALLILILLSALSVALLYKVNYEQKLQRSDTSTNVAYYGAEAGMEKMMADLDALYASEASPDWCSITGLQAAQPSVSDIHVTYSEYQITIPNAPTDCSTPPSHVQTISQGPNAGLIAQIVPLTLRVTADHFSGEQASGTPTPEEVRLIRQVEVAEIPVFQFGVFSESDLSFFPGPAFDFNGRVHTNHNLFLASTASLTFHSSIRAAGDIVRDQLANGASTVAQARLGTILVPTTTAGCDGGKPACRNLGVTPTNEGSAIGGPTPANGGTGSTNPSWTSLSNSTYNGTILSGSTGAKQLSMAFVQQGVNPVEILRRPAAGESLTSAVGESRMYNQAQIRVLLSDDPSELPGGAADGQNIRLANVQTTAAAPDYTSGVPVAGVGRVFFGEGTTAAVGGETNWTTVPQAEATLKPAGAPRITGTTWNLLDGYLRVEYRKSDGTYAPVTQEWLELGFARGVNMPKTAAHNAVNPNAILILQEQADRNHNGTADVAEMVKDAGTGSAITGPATRNNWYPINFYDAREGEFRENQRVTTTCFVGGVMDVVEVDVDNLRKWLAGTIGANGTKVEYTSQNGYILYVSDRRGMVANAAGVKTGEYGYEDVINPNTAAGTPNGVLDTAEDVNGNGKLDTFGAATLGLGYAAASSGSPNKSVNCLNAARPNWVSGARHAVRLVDGALGELPSRPDNGEGGFTLAAENAAYIDGDYNAAGSFGDPHVSAAIVADTVTLLSNAFNDLESFNSPATTAGRKASTTWFRVAIASGKNINFPQPAFAGVPQDFGTDGGVHNFLRYLEDWGGVTSNYLGSMASLYYSQYATGVFKCCGTVYGAPTRNYAFDTDFLDISKMPPGTPKFRDVVSLGFQQVF